MSAQVMCASWPYANNFRFVITVGIGHHEAGSAARESAA
jgi:hypothetical protein